jgi:UPF0042 nucleotide-binding protein
MPEMKDTTPTTRRVTLVTGPSGAGRSTAINVLEDLGFEAIDNLPLTLMPRLLDGRPLDRPLALGVDTRNRDFSVDALTRAISDLSGYPTYEALLLYLDCRPDVLLRRYSETRRRHPYAPDGTPSDGIAREMALVGPLKDRADLLVDTSDMSPHDLRAALERHFGGKEGDDMAISVQSFSYKRGVPQDLDTVFDVRFLNNPHWIPDLRPLDGRNALVSDYIREDARTGPFLEKVTGLLTFLLPAHREEGKTHVAVGFGCTGGKHRSVAMAETVANTLAEAGWRVSIRHRELERRSGTPRVELG